jgi:phosphate butyryltransferase
MPLPSFDELRQKAGSRLEPAVVAVAGGDDPTVLEAMVVAVEQGWVRPILVGPEPEIRATAGARGLPLDGITLRHAPIEEMATVATREVRAGRAQALMKGQIDTPALMKAILDIDHGLRSGRVICQVVLMEIPRDGRRFLMADTGICVQPSLPKKVDIMRSTVAAAHALGLSRPRVALMAATETVKPTMPETLHADELTRRGERGEFPDCVVQGPLSFDLAYTAAAGERKRIGGSVVGAADIMIFPNLLAGNLTVKAMMCTASCRFGGVLCGVSAPVVFMSRADSTETRLNSLAFTLALLDQSTAKRV